VGTSETRYSLGVEPERVRVNQIRILDLINSGLIGLEDRFSFKSGNVFRGPVATVQPDGNFVIIGEGSFSSPSSLASHVSGGKSYNGWQVIARITDGLTLESLRKIHLKNTNTK